MSMQDNSKGLLSTIRDVIKKTVGKPEEKTENPEEMFVLNEEDKLTPKPLDKETTDIAEIFLEEDE